MNQTCRKNVLSLTKGGDGTSTGAIKTSSSTSQFVYYLGASEWTYTPKIAHSDESCSMTCRLTEDGHQPDMDVITKFNKKTGSFSLFTDDAYVYNREVLKMSVACKSDNAASEVVDDVTIHIRKPLK